jgi:uncharacterized membrane protein YkoI
MIDRDAAVRIARARAEANGWAFAEPLEIAERRGWFGKKARYEIATNASKRGSKARFVIDAATGEVLSEGYISR